MRQQTDLDILNAARHASVYGGRRNSIVEWTLSPDWCRNPVIAGPDTRRGHIRKWGADYHLNTTHGEFTTED